MPGPDEAALVADAFSRRRVPTLVADVGARDAGSRGAARHAVRRCCCRWSRGGERVGLLAVGFDQRAVGRAVSARRRRRRPTRSSTALELFRLRQARRAAARRPRAARRVRRQPLGDAEPVGRPRHLLPRRQPAVRRRSHVGLDPRSARPSPRAAGLVRSRPTSRAASRVSADDVARAGRGRDAARRAPRSSSPRDDDGDGDGHRAAARLPPRARHDRLRGRARRDRRRARPARSRRRARPPAVERHREHAAARRRDAVAARAREHLRLDRAPGRRLRPRGRIVHVNQAFADARRPHARASCSTGRSPTIVGPELGGVARRRTASATRGRDGDAAVDRRGRRPGAERAVHGHGHRSARSRPRARSAACSSRAT